MGTLVPDLVSVIIPCYNGARFLPEAIESVLNQTHLQFEIILVDDGSVDNSIEVVSRYPRIRCIIQTNQGVAAARNRGVRESQGSYLVFLNQDDRLLPNALEINLGCLKAHPDRGFIFGCSRLIASDGTPWQHEIEQQPVEEKDYYRAFLSGGQICSKICPPSTVMFRRAVFDFVGGFDASMPPADDYDMYLRIARLFPIYCHNQEIVEYRIHDANQSGNSALMLKACLRALKAQWKYVKGNKDYEEAYNTGKKYWQDFWGNMLIGKVPNQVKTMHLAAAGQNIFVLLKYHPQGLLRTVYKMKKVFLRSQPTY